MTKTSVLISSDGTETGTLLVDYLRARNVFDANGPAATCYGLSTDTRPALNHSCKSDKITRMQRMQAAGVTLVPWTNDPVAAAQLPFPLYARQMRGYGAKDLMPVFQAEEIPWRVKAGWDWFSSIVPIREELRVWVWRGEVLDVYTKVMCRQESYRALGRNFGQGFEFVPYTTAAAEPKRQAIAAVNALGLDFAAVDMILPKDQDSALVLESNTAGGVIRSGCQKTLAKLADRIAEWAKADCPTYDGYQSDSAVAHFERPSGNLQARSYR